MSTKLQSFRDLVVWQKSMDLAVPCYEISKTFAKSETYGLCSQLQRAAVSVPFNIAEGYARQHLKEYLHHLFIASGSPAEVETQIELAHRLHFITKEEADKIDLQCAEVGRMLRGLRMSLRNKLQADNAS